MFELHKWKNQQDQRRILKAIIPRFVIMAGRRMNYRRRFPKAFISCESKIQPGAVIGEHAIINDSDLGSNVEIGSCTTVGARCRFDGRGKIKIGKFCSLAAEGFYWSENHTLDSVSSYPFEWFLKRTQQNFSELKGEDIVIGNDVWIGQRAIILAGVRIGDGCVIGAGSVVVRGDYPPYSLLAGVPARIVRQRLPADKMEELLRMKWWDKDTADVFGPLMDYLHSGKKSN